MPLLPLTPILPLLPKVLDWLWGRPRYQRARLLGERLVAELAKAYLAEVSQRLRPGSFKSVRFALELLTSHLGKHAVGDLSLSHGKEVLGYITQLSPTCASIGRGRRPVCQSSQRSPKSRRASLWHPRPRPAFSSRCPSSLTGVLVRESWEPTPGRPLRVMRQARCASPWCADG